jgi:hypothetical protein
MKASESHLWFEAKSRSWNICSVYLVKGFGFIRKGEEPCVKKKESGFSKSFPLICINDILLIEYDVYFLKCLNKRVTEK